MASFTRRMEVLEGDVHNKALENTALKKEIGNLKRQIETKDEELQNMKTKHERASLDIAEKLNDQEQYSRTNSIRITTIPEDDPKETALQTADKVVKNLNKYLKLNLSSDDIDISHRLGKYKPEGRGRAVIVKFVQRTTKQAVMSNRKHLKKHGYYSV